MEALVSSVPGGDGTRRDDEDCGSSVGEGAKFADLFGARGFEGGVE